MTQVNKLTETIIKLVPDIDIEENEEEEKCEKKTKKEVKKEKIQAKKQNS